MTEGYTFDTPNLPASPVTVLELEALQQSLLLGDADVAALRQAGEILVPKTEQILDVWYGFVASHPHLVAVFAGPDGQPDTRYLEAVRGRFGQWISDVCTRGFDQRWLAYQDEIGKRHHTSKKNATDDVDSLAKYVPLRDLIALIVPITVTIRDFLAVSGVDAEQVDAMYNAWFKAVTLSVALWARPYCPDTW